MIMKHKGFTLIELLIVIAIMSVLLVGSIAALVSTNSSTTLERGQKELAAEISLARAYALQGKTQGGSTPCGYGVQFNNDQQQYTIFYNVFLDTTNGKNCDDQNRDQDYRKYLNSGSLPVETKVLPGQVKIHNSGDLVVYFAVPSGTVYYNIPGGGADGEGELLSSGNTESIGLTNDNGTTTVNVNISSTGLVTLGGN